MQPAIVGLGRFVGLPTETTYGLKKQKGLTVRLLNRSKSDTRERHDRLQIHATLAEETQSLKDRLIETLDLSIRLRRLKSKGADVEEATEALCAAGGKVSADDLAGDRLEGRFENMKFFSKNAIADDTTTCGILTFGYLHPKNLKIRVLFVDMESKGANSDDWINYRVTTTFEVDEGEKAGLRGKSTVKAHAHLSEDPSLANRQYISFEGVEIRAADPQQQEAWLRTFKEANPEMDSSGVLDVKFPEPADGWRDVIYVDDDFHISIGNRGGTSFLRKLPS
eukprot:jgi/Botrbrau1/16147/Bobra.0281s0004.1